VLLDSHVLLWWMEDDPRLGPIARAALEAAARPSFSAASIWELLLKAGKGSLSLPESFERDVVRSGLAEVPVTAAHARAMLTVDGLDRHDPFDSLLVAQAKAERMQFLTADRKLLELGLGFVRDARR
jgi:PIN domain nuclease of toxin-antitoxin system